MEKDRRQNKCITENCKGIVYRQDNKILCTECAMQIDAKRYTDTHLMSFKQLQREYNGG